MALLTLAATFGVRAAEAAPEPHLRAVSFNVQFGQAIDREHQGGPPAMARLFSLDPRIAGVDVLALQEVCGANDTQLGYFRRVIGVKRAAFHAFAPSDANDHGPCRRGEAIVTPHPIVASGALELPNVRQPRSAVWADVMLPRSDGSKVLTRVYSVHLENRASGMAWATGRLKQTQAVLAHLLAWREAHPGAPVLVLGDLNTLGRGWDLWTREPALLAFGEHLTPTTTRRTQTHRILPHQLDWIFFDGLTLRSSRVPRVVASDHYPVVADFDLLPPVARPKTPLAAKQ